MSQTDDGPRSQGPPGAERYLLEQEDVVFAVRRHAAQLVWPVASLVGAAIAVLVLDALLPPGLALLRLLLVVGSGVLAVRIGIKVLQWRVEWFLATNRRLILTTGLITRKVAMMPLSKVTDMSYAQSPLGRLFGYGRFVLESAGHDQALQTINYVPAADVHYRALCTVLFGAPPSRRG